MQHLEGQPHPRGRARSQVLHQYVGLGQELVEHLGSGVLLHVQAQAFLRAVGPDEMRGQAVDPLVITAGEIAGTGPLDLDHPCAEVGQLARAERRGDGVLEADHGDAIEWAGFDLGVVHVRFLQIRRRVENGEAFSTRLFKPLGTLAPLWWMRLRRHPPYDSASSRVGFSPPERVTCGGLKPTLRSPQHV